MTSSEYSNCKKNHTVLFSMVCRQTAAAFILAATLLGGVLAQAQTPEDFGYRAMTVEGKAASGGRKVQIILASVDGSPAFAHPDSYYECTVFAKCIAPGPRNVKDYTREVSAGRFAWEEFGAPISFSPYYTQGTMFDEDNLIDVIRWAFKKAYGWNLPWGGYPLGSDGVDTAQYAVLRSLDTNNDNRVTADELSFLVVHNTTGSAGATRDICFRPIDVPMDVCTKVSSVGHRASLMTMARELTHQLGAVDVYAGQCGACMNANLSLMAASTGADDVLTTFHLDPWHKIQLGWTMPAIRDLRTAGSDYVQPADLSSSRPVILYDSSRGPGEFFILEYRRRSGYDSSVAGEGLAIWHVQNGPGRSATVMRAPLEYAVYHAGYPTLARGKNTVWTGGSVTPTLQWNDGTATLYRISVDSFYPNAPGITFSWFNRPPLVTGGPLPVSRHAVALAAYNGKFVIAANGGGTSITATSKNAWSFEQLLMTDINGGELMSGDSIYLQTFSGHYISAEAGGGQALVANRTTAGGWETFIIRKVNGSGVIRSMDPVSLQVYNLQYVAAEGGGNGPLMANRSAVGGWETFTLVTRSTAVLVSYNGQYLTAENGGGGTVNANRPLPGGWEGFNFEVAQPDGSGGILRHGTPVNIRTSNGMYWVAEQGGDGRVNANRTVPGGWEQFTIEKAGGSSGDVIQNGDYIALRAMNGRYVTAENGGGGEVNANRQSRGGWETFRIQFYPFQ